MDGGGLKKSRTKHAGNSRVTRARVFYPIRRERESVAPLAVGVHLKRAYA